MKPAVAGPLRSRRFLLVAAALVVAIAAIYGQVYDHQFIAYDDDSYLYTVPEVKAGLTVEGLRWAFDVSHPHAGNYHPLTWLSHMLDAQLFGMRPGGHHLESAGLHALNAVILAGVLVSATGAFWPSLAVAALFALHPLRVESVAWASERKDVLSTLFGLLALAAYVRSVRRPDGGRVAAFGLGDRQLAVFALFALGLLAKPMLVTLPFALLLLDWWPLGRFSPPAARAAGSGLRPWLAPVFEKAPLFVLSVAWCFVTMWAQTTNVLAIVTPDLPTRIGNAALSYVRYLADFFWPAQLAFLYPYPTVDGVVAVSGAGPAIAAVILLLITGAVLAYARRFPFLPMGWFWYVGMLVPVVGFVQVGGQARSDRYTYLTTTGFAIALVWLAATYWPRRTGLRRALAAGFLLAIAALGAIASSYTAVWKNSLTLFGYTVGVTRDNYLVLNNYGTALMQAGRNDEAISWLRETARVNPKHCNADYNLGVALYQRQRYTEAVMHLLRSLQCYDQEGREGIYIADTHYNLGLALAGMGKLAEAESHFRAALNIAPKYPGASAALGELIRRQKAAGGGRPPANP